MSLARVSKKKLFPLAVSANLLAIGLILYALLGFPDLAFFSALKFAVIMASLLSACACFMVSPWLSLLSLSLIIVGYVHVFSELRRSEWAIWNWSAIGMLGLATIILLLALVKWTKKGAIWAISVSVVLFFAALYGWARYDAWVFQQSLTPTSTLTIDEQITGSWHLGVSGRLYRSDHLLTSEDRDQIDEHDRVVELPRVLKKLKSEG